MGVYPAARGAQQQPQKHATDARKHRAKAAGQENGAAYHESEKR